jgi:acetyltransferase
VRDARRFMSALSAACRAKPVVVLKAGSFASGSTADITHSGAIVGSDSVFDVAIRRAGAVRSESLNQFFAAAKTLSTRHQPAGNRLAIVTNGSGPGLMAADQIGRRWRVFRADHRKAVRRAAICR